MIEKLEIKKVPVPNNPTLAKNVGMDNESLFDKINELVDVVNELQEFADVADKNLVKLMEDATREENVQDKFAEQRRWIGKLCWYKLCEGDTWKVGRLEKIQENADAGYPFVFDGLCYKICEPVKPDDDIIYKGEDNA